MQSWAPIWYHHRFHEFILVCEIIHIVYPNLPLSLHSGSISVEWLLYTMSYSRWLNGLMIFDTGYSFDIHLLYVRNSMYFIFLLTLISVDIPAWLLIIIIIQSCFMLVGADSWLYVCLLLALFFILCIYSLIEYFIIFTSLYFVWFTGWRYW